jgi:hypothetical protein
MDVVFSIPGMMADCGLIYVYEQLFQSQHILFLIEMNDIFAKNGNVFGFRYQIIVPH